MKKYNLQLIEGKSRQDGVLNVKDSSFTIVLSSGELIKLPYDEITDYSVIDGNLTIKLLNNTQVVVACKIDNFLQDKLDSIINDNSIQEEKTKPKEVVETNNRINNKYNAVVFLANGQVNADVSLTNSDVLVDDGGEVLNIPISSIIRLSLEENGNIKIYSNNNSNLVIKCENSQELYDRIKKLKSKTTYKTTSNVGVKDVFGNDVLKAQKKKNNTMLIVYGIIAVVVFFIFISSISTGSTQEKRAEECIAKIFPTNASSYKCKYSHIGRLVNCENGLLHLQLYESDDGKRFIVRGEVEKGKYVVLNKDCFGGK